MVRLHHLLLVNCIDWHCVFRVTMRPCIPHKNHTNFQIVLYYAFMHASINTIRMWTLNNKKATNTLLFHTFSSYFCHENVVDKDLNFCFYCGMCLSPVHLFLPIRPRLWAVGANQILASHSFSVFGYSPFPDKNTNGRRRTALCAAGQGAADGCIGLKINK